MTQEAARPSGLEVLAAGAPNDEAILTGKDNIPDEELEDGTGVLGLPGKFNDYRPHQENVVTEILTAFVSGKRFMIAELPTGSGKTMISMAVRQLLDDKTLYVCTTKALQEQFLSDFPHAKLIKGRSNYPCGQFADRFPDITADDCPAKRCTLACPYITAKKEALHAKIAVMNMAYFLSEIQHAGQFRGRQFIIVDEADTLEDALLDAVSVQISQIDIDFLNLGKPDLKTKFETWREWAEKAYEKINSGIDKITIELKNYQRGVEDDEDWSTTPIELIRRRKRYDRLAAKLAFFLKHVDKYWVWERSEAVFGTRIPAKWTFKPVRVDQFGNMIYKEGEKFLFMSATFLDFPQWERNVGLEAYRDEGFVSETRLGSVFSKEQRPVIVKGGIDLSYKKEGADLPKLILAVKEILDAHPGEKGIIHTVKFDTAQFIANSFPERVIVHTASNRLEVIRRFKESKLPTVLASPSIERGEDFPDDLCRFIVVVKLPYPYLGDPRIGRRLHSQYDGQRWYTLKTVSRIIQMTGRGMRHENDQCTSYILDAGFDKLYKGNRSLFPQWWRESLIWQLPSRKGKEG